ncbi:MAG: hypothetical protein A4E23_00367 [Methanomethylovorans sp. PtaU1.Bin073]|nr:MAG: hypothetical protein A4E23_00367 [Methanomethylovorans sp. PtaU1.Bin073]
MNYFHSNASPTCRCLNYNRITNIFCNLCRLVQIRYSIFRTRNYRDSCFAHSLTGFYLTTHLFDDIGRGAYENNSCFLTFGCKYRILREETIARMDSLGTCLFSHIKYFLHIEITLTGRCRAYKICFISILCKEGILISFRIYSNRLHAQFSAGAHCPNGYFTPICNEYFIEHENSSFDRHQYISGRD